MYSENTLFIIGNSKTAQDNAITHLYHSFFIGFVVEETTGVILDVGCSVTIRVTEEFIRSLFLNKSLNEFDEEVEREIERRYHGSSQKAIVVAYRDAVKKFKEVRQKYQ